MTNWYQSLNDMNVRSVFAVFRVKFNIDLSCNEKMYVIYILHIYITYIYYVYILHIYHKINFQNSKLTRLFQLGKFEHLQHNPKGY